MEDIQKIVSVNIEDEMKKSYVDYAMSVIIGRALPDVRDGLKPVHRRILFAMYEQGNTHNKPFRKSARIVGDVIGKYHPHGDSAVYDTAVRMAQDFSMRYLLIDGQGNFGSIDGDSPAAMRYTEIRMERITNEILRDLDKETVDFVPNYDESLAEPVVLPSAVPNLLVNGSSGIAVGMATNIPPHNLGEVVDGLIALIENPEMTIEGLMELIPGPDFPMEGIIYGRNGIVQAYNTGKGIIQLRSLVNVEKMEKGDRERIVIASVPYQVNKARLVERIAELIKEKKIEGVQDLRDESDSAVRVVLDLKKDAESKVLVNQLLKLTPMQTSYGMNLIALVNNQPQMLNLKDMLSHFITHRKEIVTKRCLYELRKAEERAHILEGLKIALDNLDRVIALIRGSETPKEAKEGLIHEFSFSPIQAQAILDMRLHRLTGLERDKINEEYSELLKTIARLKEILANERMILALIVEELKELKDTYGDDRRTEIIADTEEIELEDLIAEEDMVVTISHDGYIKRSPVTLYQAQHRGGRGKSGMDTKEDDFVENLFVASTHDYVLIFTDHGRVHWLKVYRIPQVGRTSRGKAIVNLLELQGEEGVAAMLPVSSFEEGKYVVMATRNGVIKKTDLMAYSNPRRGGIIAITLDEGDRVVKTRLTDGTREIMLASRKGKAIRFKEDRVRSMGRVSRGVRGIKLAKDDCLIALEIPAEGATILCVSEKGYGKRSEITDYPLRNRGGMGVITMQTSERNGDVASVRQVSPGDDLMLITDQGTIIRIRVDQISIIGRNTQGVKLIGLQGGHRVTSIARVVEKGPV